jgi:hypothetical protein
MTAPPADATRLDGAPLRAAVSEVAVARTRIVGVTPHDARSPLTRR